MNASLWLLLGLLVFLAGLHGYREHKRRNDEEDGHPDYDDHSNWFT